MKRLVRIGLPLGLLLVAVALAAVTRRVEARAASPFPLAPTVAYSPAFERLAASKELWYGDEVRGEIPLQLALEPGDTVGGLLADLGLPPLDRGAVIEELAAHADLRRLRPRDGYAVIYDPASRGVRAFHLTLAGRGRVRVEQGPEGWHGRFEPFRRRTEVRAVRGTLEGALESSIERAGGDPRLTVLLADVFQWDIDFNRDLRLGDRFEVLYERVSVDGGFDSLGTVLAAHYTSGERRLEAYRFGQSSGFYDAEGRPLRKMFLRSPMRYSRVTSRYSNRRFHPVLKTYRPHYGVDYGAPTGTPVRVTASGVVTLAGWNGGGGKTVKVRHTNGYLTAYLHLSRFADGIRPGRRVRQGETIGYVGATGLATASHLDYRVQLRGRWIDPLSLRSIPADPIPTERLAEFEVWREAYRESLGMSRSSAALTRLLAGAAEVDPETVKTASVAARGGGPRPSAGG